MSLHVFPFIGVPQCLLKLSEDHLRQFAHQLGSSSQTPHWKHLAAFLAEYKSSVMPTLYQRQKGNRRSLAVAEGRIQLLPEGEQPKQRNIIEDLANTVDLTVFVQGNYCLGTPPTRYGHLELFMEFQASPNGTGGSKTPLKVLVNSCWLYVIYYDLVKS